MVSTLLDLEQVFLPKRFLKKNMFNRLFYLGILTFFLWSLALQPWALWAQASAIPLGGKGTVNPLILKEISSHNVLLAGTFGGELRIGEALRLSKGGQDVFFSLWEGENMLWLQSFGGPDSEILAVEPSESSDELMVFLVFWGQIDLGDTVLVNPLGGQALLSLKLSLGEGRPLALAMYPSEGTIQQLQHAPAGVQSGFLSFRLNGTLRAPTGEILVASQRSLVVMGYEGEAYSLLAVMPVEGNATLTSMVWADSVLQGVGYFNGRISHGQESIATVSIYDDGFAFRYAMEEDSLSLKRYGGIFDNQLLQTFFFEDRIYVGGHFSGVLELEENIRLESNGFSTDWVLFRLDEQGKVEQVWQSSSSSTELYFYAQVQATQVHLGMQYLGQMEWENGNLVCDPQGVASAILTLEGETLSKVKSFCFSGNTNNPLLLRTGNWEYSVFTNDRDFSYMGEDFVLEGVNDGFLWIEPLTALVSSVIPEPSAVRVFPNPSGREAYLYSDGPVEWEVYDAGGRRWQRGRSSAGEKVVLAFPGLGVYYIVHRAVGGGGGTGGALGESGGPSAWGAGSLPKVWKQVVVE